MEKVNLAEKFSLFSDHFSPKVVGELNGQQVKLVKFCGEFTWHHHEQEDNTWDEHLYNKCLKGITL